MMGQSEKPGTGGSVHSAPKKRHLGTKCLGFKDRPENEREVMDMSQAASHINWLAVLVAPLVGFLLGGLWYGPLFGKAWARACGITEAQMGAGNKGKIFGGTYALNLVASGSLAMFIGPAATWQFGLMAGTLTGSTFISTALGVTYLFEGRPLRLWAINAGLSDAYVRGDGGHPRRVALAPLASAAPG